MASNIDLGLGDDRWMGVVELIANKKQLEKLVIEVR